MLIIYEDLSYNVEPTHLCNVKLLRNIQNCLDLSPLLSEFVSEPVIYVTDGNMDGQMQSFSKNGINLSEN